MITVWGGISSAAFNRGRNIDNCCAEDNFKEKLLGTKVWETKVWETKLGKPRPKADCPGRALGTNVVMKAAGTP